MLLMHAVFIWDVWCVALCSTCMHVQLGLVDSSGITCVVLPCAAAAVQWAKFGCAQGGDAFLGAPHVFFWVAAGQLVWAAIKRHQEAIHWAAVSVCPDWPGFSF